MNDTQPNKQPQARRQKGKGSIFSRVDSPFLWIKYSRRGKPFSESTGLTDERKAQKLLDRRLAEIETNTFAGPLVERVRMQELFDDVQRDYRVNARKSIDDLQARWTLHLKPFFGVLRAVDAGGLIPRYVDARRQEGALNATINRELAVLKRMFRLGHQSTPPKVLHIPHVTMLAEDNIRTGFLEASQYDKLFEVGYTYGWRVSEVLNLTVQQVNLLAGTIRLEPNTTKNKQGRQVVLTESARLWLIQCMVGKSATDYIFTRKNGKAVRDFRDAWAKATAEAGVPGLRFHDLRRSAARELRRAGVAEGVIMKVGGWKTRSMFERYAIVDAADMQDAINELQAQRERDKEPQAQREHDKLRTGYVATPVVTQPASNGIN